MRSLITLATMLLVGLVGSPPAQAAASRTSIVGGQPTEITTMPFVSALVLRTREIGTANICASSYIGGRWLLTAAHCLVNERPGRVAAVFGRSHLRESAGTSIQARRFYLHPRFNGYSEHHDLALIRLARAPKIAPVTFAANDRTLVLANAEAVIAGWGAISTNKRTTQLHSASVNIFSSKRCASKLSYAPRKLILCAQGDMINDTRTRSDNCFGDSGGPLAVYFENRWILVGVTSTGAGECGDPTIPGAYARIATRHKWISRVTGLDLP